MGSKQLFTSSSTLSWVFGTYTVVLPWAEANGFSILQHLAFLFLVLLMWEMRGRLFHSRESVPCKTCFCSSFVWVEASTLTAFYSVAVSAAAAPRCLQQYPCPSLPCTRDHPVTSAPSWRLAPWPGPGGSYWSMCILELPSCYFTFFLVSSPSPAAIQLMSSWNICCHFFSGDMAKQVLAKFLLCWRKIHSPLKCLFKGWM